MHTLTYVFRTQNTHCSRHPNRTRLDSVVNCLSGSTSLLPHYTKLQHLNRLSPSLSLLFSLSHTHVHEDQMIKTPNRWVLSSIPTLIQSLTLVLCNNTQIHCSGTHIRMITCSMLLTNSAALAPLPSRCTHAGTCAHTRTHSDMHQYSHKYIPRDSLHLCQHSILPALTSCFSHTEEHEDQL